MILVSFVLMYVWPFIYNVLVVFGENIKDLGSLGAGIYAFQSPVDPGWITSCIKFSILV